MVTHNRNLTRVTLTLDPVDVELLDRLAALEGLNRSAELRSMLGQLRPVLRATVEAFEAATRQRDALEAAAGQVEISKLQQLMPEAERISGAYLGALARIEGLSAAEAARDDDADPRPSNTGVTPPPPLYPESPKKPRKTGK